MRAKNTRKTNLKRSRKIISRPDEIIQRSERKMLYIKKTAKTFEINRFSTV